jgi:hypothetical protein
MHVKVDQPVSGPPEIDSLLAVVYHAEVGV